jgi:hypothetical protein
MKFLFSILFVFVCFAGTTQAQTESAPMPDKEDLVKTAEIKVGGVCNMCKERIENAAYVKGVKKATWDKVAGLLTVTYRSDKTDQTTIEKAVAKAGHDAGDQKATQAQYDKIPGCCRYRGGEVKVH